MSFPKLPRWALVLIGLTAAIILLFASSCVYLSLDEPPQDASDLLLTYRNIPESENAYALLVTLGQKVPDPFAELDDQSEERLESIQRGEVWDSELVNRLLQDTKHLWQDLDNALSAPYSQARQLHSYADVIPEVGQFRRLTQLARIRAIQLAHEGAPMEGIALLETLVHLGHTLQNSQGVIITWLTGSAIKSDAMKSLVLIAKDFTPSNSSLTNTISTLESQSTSASSLNDSFKTEYHVLAKTVIELKKGRADEIGYILEVKDTRFIQAIARLPMALKVNKTLRIYAEHLRQVNDLTDTDHQTVEQAEVSKEFWKYTKSFPNPDNCMGRILLAIITPTYEGVIGARFREESRISATRAFLALRAYQQDHDGELPPTLNVLVPDYLSSVPLDYYDREPIRYSPEFRAIWSLGQKGDYTVTSLDQEPEKSELHLRIP